MHNEKSAARSGGRSHVRVPSRRSFLRGAALIAGSAAASEFPAKASAAGEHDVGTERFALTTPGPNVPRISYALAHGGLVYTSGVTAHVAGDGVEHLAGDVKVQTHQVLAKIDELLAEAGTNKSRLLSAQVWLTDMANFTAHCEAWNDWVDHDNPPVRACLLSPQLWAPGLLVEIMVVAKR